MCANEQDQKLINNNDDDNETMAVRQKSTEAKKKPELLNVAGLCLLMCLSPSASQKAKNKLKQAT